MPRVIPPETITEQTVNDATFKRRQVLRHTVKQFEENSAFYKRIAADNHLHWQQTALANPSEPKVRVVGGQPGVGDWGEVALAASKRTGAIYAVLNMANAYAPGGGYLHGMIAQEENMYRRSDCHFYLLDSEMNEANDRYTTPMTELIDGAHGRVYLDVENPRVCIKAKESPQGDGEGYAMLQQDNYFQFYELKAAADDLRNYGGAKAYNEESMRKKIAAQLETLMENNIRHVILAPFGCGAFQNPARKVAQLYREEITKRAAHFDDIVFAVYDAGYGPKNYPAFAEILNGLRLGKAPENDEAVEVQVEPAPIESSQSNTVNTQSLKEALDEFSDFQEQYQGVAKAELGHLCTYLFGMYEAYEQGEVQLPQLKDECLRNIQILQDREYPDQYEWQSLLSKIAFIIISVATVGIANAVSYGVNGRFTFFDRKVESNHGDALQQLDNAYQQQSVS